MNKNNNVIRSFFFCISFNFPQKIIDYIVQRVVFVAREPAHYALSDFIFMLFPYISLVRALWMQLVCLATAVAHGNS